MPRNRESQGPSTGADAATSPDATRDAAAEAPFAALMTRILPSDALRRDGAAVVRAIAADEAERAAIAESLDLPRLDRLAFDAEIASHGDDGWRLDGVLRADGAQRCGVTLEPAPFALEEPVVRLWSPSVAERADHDAWEVDAADLLAASDPLYAVEELERLPDPIDLGVVAIEAFCLALDPYPRAPSAAFDGASAAPPGVEPLSDEAVRPFAALASLVNQAADPAPEGASPPAEQSGEPSDDDTRR